MPEKRSSTTTAVTDTGSRQPGSSQDKPGEDTSSSSKKDLGSLIASAKEEVQRLKKPTKEVAAQHNTQDTGPVVRMNRFMKEGTGVGDNTGPWTPLESSQSSSF